MHSLVTPLSEEHVPAASQALGEAFMNDPLQSYVFTNPEEREEKSPPHFEAVLRYGLMFGEVYTLPQHEGAVVWLPPGKTEITPDMAEKGGLLGLPAVLGESAAERFFTVMDYLDPFHKEDMPEPHWYTMVIGIAPALCRKGYGRKLMQPVMEKAREQRIPIYLETAEPTNIHFYTKLGFRVLRELTEPVSGLSLWTFRKDG